MGPNYVHDYNHPIHQYSVCIAIPKISHVNTQKFIDHEEDCNSALCLIKLLTEGDVDENPFLF
jgi:hypothetical protein